MRTTVVLLRAAGWPAILGLTLCAALVGGVALSFAGRVGTSAQLLDVAAALLAAAAGFALEEPAASVVDLTPTRSAQLTAARALALLPPVLTGCALAALFAASTSGLPALDLSVKLLGSSILGFTLADVARQRIDEPGAVVAVLVVLLVVVTPMIGAVARQVHTVPTTVPTTDPDTPGLSSNATWAFVMAACFLAIAVTANSDRRYRHGWVHTKPSCRHARRGRPRT